MFRCLTCQKEFSSEGSLEKHLRVHGGAESYYQSWYPRRDLFDGTIIQFKNKKQYLSTFFNSYANRLSFYNSVFGREAKDVLLTEFFVNKDLKDYSFLPSHCYLKLAKMAGVDQIRKHYGSCQEFCKEGSVEYFYKNKLPKGFWEDKIEEFNMEVHIDTREQKPFEFSKSLFNKLDFGDYTAGRDKYSKTFVDRKSPFDFMGTFASQSNFDRFKKEIERAESFGSFLYVVVETTIDSLPNTAGIKKYCKNFDKLQEFAFHNVREILIKNYKSCQFIFCRNRQEANDITRKILFYGKDLWECDLSYFLEFR